MMQFTYGSYTHPAGEVSLTITKRPVFSARGFRVATRETWNLQGILQGSSPQDVSSKIADLQTAYGANGKDAKLLLPGGSTSAHALISSDTLGGVRVTSLNFPEGRGAEFSTFRTYAITLEADFAEAESTLLRFEESLDVTGTAGAKTKYLTTLDAGPQKQTIFTRTTVTLVQSGSALGYLAYPLIPPPIFPEAEHVERRRISRGPVRESRGVYTDFPVQWNYVFESDFPLTGFPHLSNWAG
jgi:hypothetical protein